jgi:hypothetical protein
MSSKPKDMLRGHREVFQFLKKELEEMVAAGTFVVNINEDGEEKIFQFHLLPQQAGSFFKVNLKISRGSRPLPLLFSLHNLYLLGFEHANLWHVFDDADLSGSGHDLEGNRQFWVKLGIKGRYHDNVFNRVKLGIREIHSIYHILSGYSECKAQGKHAEVDAALFRVIVVLPETWRFPRWRACLYRTFMYAPRVVDRRPAQEDDEYEPLFKMWKNICIRVLAGADEFHRFGALAGYNEYAQLLPAVSTLIRRQIHL